ncbi:T9SS type A sorting domain-containing protein, partial [Tenacibaculum sp. S7007]
TVRDDCGNDATVSTTVSRDYDETDPIIVAIPEVPQLCNEELPESLEARWEDNCSVGGDLLALKTNERIEGCIKYADYVFEAQDDCGNKVREVVTLSSEFDQFEACETAFARYDENSCFLNDGFNRWGWTNYFAEEGVYTMPLYAGAPVCDPVAEGKGTQTGEVTVTYQGGFVSVEYNLFEGYAMNTAQVYIGCEKYPTKNGKETVAPGQYNFKSGNLDYGYNYKFEPVAATGPIYVIAHAVTCEEICRCSVPTDEGKEIETSGSINCGEAESQSVEIIEPVSFNAYPVPFEDELSIQYKYEFDTDVTIEVYTINGLLIKKVVNDSYEKSTSNITKLDLTGVQNQTLIVRLITSKGVANRKVIAKRPKKRK